MLFPSLALGERSPLGVGFCVTAGLPVFFKKPQAFQKTPRVFLWAESLLPLARELPGAGRGIF